MKPHVEKRAGGHPGRPARKAAPQPWFYGLASAGMALGWPMAGKSISRTDRSVPEAEKITINLGFVDLGQIDLLVKEGFYSIRNAIRQQISQHGDAVRQVVARKTLALGLQHFSRSELEAIQAAGEKLQVRVLGMASIALDVSVDLARATIDSMVVLGSLYASPEVKAALADRLH